MTWEMLYNSMAERWRPEDVAALSSVLVPDLGDVLRQAKRGAYFGGPHFERFGRPGFRGHSVDTSITTRFPNLPTAPTSALSYLRSVTGLASSDLRDRLPSPLRKQALPGMSRRQYMKLCRIQLSLARKLARVHERGLFVRWTRVARSGWAVDLEMADFMAMTPATRVFVAYYVARRQRQSVFSGDGQDSHWDKVAANLFDHSTPTRAVGLAFPDARVLSLISAADRVDLLVRAYRDLRDMAVVMADLWRTLGADAATMVVRRGMNSSDWNAVAGAWNAVRTLWVALLYSCGRETDLDTFCPGKAMRLMAADVAAWHRMNGEDEGPDVKVFKMVPLPWDVVLGTAACSRGMVEDAAALAGMKRGKCPWTTPISMGTPVPTRPTMALVHGVAVSDPALADVLRRAGWFSGKPASPLDGLEGFAVDRNEGGFAIGVA